MLNRINKLRTNFNNLNIDGMLVSSEFNRMYLTGFTGTTGHVLISRDKNLFITDFRYIEQAKKQCDGFEIVALEKTLKDTLLNVITREGYKSLGFEGDHVTYQQYLNFSEAFRNINMVPVNNLTEKLRMIKDAEEIQKIRTAARIADEAFTHILNIIRPGISELEIALELEFFMRKRGASGVSFDFIVASGQRSSMPHGVASNKLIEEGDCLTLDFGCIYQGYCSDMTRTIFIGKADEKLKKIYDIVLKAQLSALRAVKPGLVCSSIDEIARGIIKDNGFGKNFGHGLGHSVGLEIHEEPRFAPSDQTLLAPGMVITVEPGIYVEGLGGVRIEDLIVITENGYENLTNSTKDLIII